MNKIQCPTPVAILMATYNGEKYISEQIESVLNQKFDKWTLYIRDDGSTDSTPDIIEKYATAYPDKIIQIDKGGSYIGCNDNFYMLLEAVDSEYYMFCDNDDVWTLDKVGTLIKTMHDKELQHPDIPIIVHHDVTVCDENLNVIHDSLWKSINIKPWKFNTFNLLMTTPIVAGATSIFNHHVKQYVFPIPSNKRIMYDHWIALCTVKHGKIFCIENRFNLYRQHEGQVCGLESMQNNACSIEVLKRKITNWTRDAQLFHTIGVPKWKFFYYKIKSNIIKS